MRPSQFNLNCRAAHASLCCLCDGLIVLPLEHLCLTFFVFWIWTLEAQRLKNVSAVSKASVSALTGVRKLPKSAVNSLKLSFFSSGSDLRKSFYLYMSPNWRR